MEKCAKIHKAMEDLTHGTIVYTYPCGAMDILCSSAPDFHEPGWEPTADSPERPKPKAREKGKKASGEDMLRSMRRARAKVRRLALANEFRWFVTLTLDGEKIDRYDGAAITKRLGRWCDNMARRHGLAYILVPERHKDGAFHFHGFFTDCVEAVDSGHTDSAGHPVFNLLQWPFGFTAAIELYGNYQRAVGYVCKYIGKQEGERPLGRWYYSGGPLREPEKVYADLDFREMEQQPGAYEIDLPGRKLVIIHTEREENNDKRNDS